MCLVAGDSNGSVLKWNFKYLLLKLHVQEFHLVDSGEDVGGSGSGSGSGGSGGNDSGPPTKLGDVLHPDLKRTTMSARELAPT